MSKYLAFIHLGMSVLFFSVGLTGTFGAKHNLGVALVGYAISLYLFNTGRLLWQDSRKSTEFCTWLAENQKAIESGTANYNGTPIDEQTELSQYFAAMSLGIVSFKVPSRFYIIGQESSLMTALSFTLCSLTIGWCGIPWGLIYTVSSVFTNLQGGRRRRVGEIIAELNGHEKKVVHLTERVAENARCIMAERGFSDGTAMQVEVSGDPGFQQYHITYDDQPPTDGSVWRSDEHGITVLVNKRDRQRIEGLLIDFYDGMFVFKDGKPKYGIPEI